jgi:hypothetical protein
VIRQVEQHHGAALARLIRAGESSTIGIRLHPEYRAAYLVDECVALYMKYATSRLSPWAFGFKIEHQNEIATLHDECNDVFVTLICGSDGIACLSSVEYQRVLDDDPRTGEWIRVARAPRQKYAVSGSDGRTICRIGDNEYPTKVYTAIRTARAAQGGEL